MPSVRGVECTFQIDGIQAPEYDVQVEDNTASFYVISESDKSFSLKIHWKNREPQFEPSDYLTPEITIDGHQQQVGVSHCIGVKPYTISHYKKHGGERDVIMRPWKFASLQFTDENDDAMGTIQDVQSLGVIKVEIYRARDRKKSTPYISKNYDDNPPISTNLVREKDIKGQPLSHKVEYGRELIAAGSMGVKFWTQRVGDVYCTFIINYRSKENLQTLGLIPYESVPDSDEEDVAGMTHEELQAELLRLRRNGQRGIKRERTNSASPIIRTPAKRIRGKMEVIDLTED
ncbi:hypothetical protein EDC01DRAFT_638244 [Geopyxis carbonaria]|nr:hypothetical protein EDC01DRAFT_638244 [Geopyxis carbonaria]